MGFCQGDIIKIAGFKYRFLIISKNAFVSKLGMFHVCPVLTDLKDGPLHIRIKGADGKEGVAVCEQIKLIDPNVRNCSKVDRITYDQIMNISDAIQGIFEYD